MVASNPNMGCAGSRRPGFHNGRGRANSNDDLGAQGSRAQKQSKGRTNHYFLKHTALSFPDYYTDLTGRREGETRVSVRKHTERADIRLTLLGTLEKITVPKLVPFRVRNS
jgi:hypothetical protein